MTGRYLVELADVARAAGLDVVEQDGWKTRARSSGGYSGNRPWCVMWHHTASSAGSSPESDAAYMSYGADARPIANVMVDRTGVVWVLAAGATNTNGTGNPLTFTRGTVPTDQMNTHAIGVEMQNTGVGEPYAPEMVDAMFRLSLALSSFYGLAPDDVATHASYSVGRKIDPATAAAVRGPWRPASINSSGTWSLDDVRAELRRRAQPSPPEPVPEEPAVEPFIIRNTTSGQIVLIYADGLTWGIPGPDVDEWTGRYGQPLPVSDPAAWDAFLTKAPR